MESVLAARVRIVAFDFHLALRPFADPALLREPWRFLADAGAYAERQRAWQPVESGAFQVRPLSRVEVTLGRDFVRNHFWPRFRASLPPGAGGLLLPLVCNPVEKPPVFATDDYHTQAAGRVWLWPFGWSSQVTLVLDHPVSLPGLQKQVAELQAGRPFSSGGEPFGLTRFLSTLGRQLAAELYAPSAERPASLSVSRSFLVSLEKLQEMPPVAPGAGAYDSLPEGERRLLHSALRGEEVPLPDRAAFTHTHFPNVGFGITSFERPGEPEGWRTLLVLHQASAEGMRTRCVSENVARVSMATQALLRVSAFDPAAGVPEAAARPLIDAARTVLLRMAERYRNPFALDVGNHREVQALRAAAADAEQAA